MSMLNLIFCILVTGFGRHPVTVAKPDAVGDALGVSPVVTGLVYCKVMLTKSNKVEPKHHPQLVAGTIYFLVYLVNGIRFYRLCGALIEY